MKVDCIVCEKPTWKGCGLHIKTALQFVEIKDRCPNWMKGSSQPCDDRKAVVMVTAPISKNTGNQQVRSAWAE